MGSVCALKEGSLGKLITIECASTVDAAGSTYIVCGVCTFVCTYSLFLCPL